MRRKPILHAWLWLVGLSLMSTAVTFWQWPAHLTALAGSVILLLAWLKARVILSDYLGLAAAPFWQRGFGLSLGLFCTLLLVLYLVPAF